MENNLKTVSFQFKEKKVTDETKQKASNFLLNKGYKILRVGQYAISAKVPQEQILSLMETSPSWEENEIEKTSIVSFDLKSEYDLFFKGGETLIKKEKQSFKI